MVSKILGVPPGDWGHLFKKDMKKTIKLEQHLKLRYLKLLHIYHNVDNTSITDGDGSSNNTIIFCKISFLNGKNSVFFIKFCWNRT